MNLHCSFLVPGALATRTGGYAYDRRIVEGLRAQQRWQVDVQGLGDGYPAPDAAARAQTRRVVEQLPDGALAVVDGLAFGVMPELARQHMQRLRWVALVHHPLSLETGLAPAQAQALFDSERQALASTRGVIVTSRSTARALAAFGVDAQDIAVVEPGTEPAALSTGSGGGPLSLLCVASITPRKGHAVLVEALAGLHQLPWTLDCAGSLAMDPDCAASLRAAIARHGLGERVRLLGELDDAALGRLQARADLFVLPSFHEGYGMALTEALARGVPVVSTNAGAIPDTVPADAGMLVPPGDVEALRTALRRMIEDPAARLQFAAGARAARQRLPTWTQSVARFAAALETCAQEARP